MSYVALYRRWRPQDFDTLVGQQPVKTALTNALASGRIAHAYLFAGPRGTGKTSTARILAKALNCDHGPTPHPCGKCVNCQRITEGTSMDVFEIDAASNRGIEEIKALREQLSFAPVSGLYKVYIIDEVHMLTTEAFNALLKTLEEPPAHVIFILATTDPHKIPATIHSRCQRFDFRRVTVDEIAEHLAMVAKSSGIDADADALRLIAIQSEGGMRDALSLLDQCGVMADKVTAATVREVLGIVGRETLRELIQAIGRQDLTTTLSKLNFLLEQGKDVRQILTELAEYLRALLLYKSAPTYDEIYLTDTPEELAKAAPLFGSDRLIAAEERLHAALNELRSALRPRITTELCLFDLCKMEGSTVAALAARVEQLEQQLAGGAVISAANAYQNYQPIQQEPVIPVKQQMPKVEPAVQRQTQPLSAEPAPQAQTKAPKQSAAPIVQKPEPVMQNQSAPQPAVSVPVEADDGGDIPTGEDYWKKVLEILTAEKKIAMVSCAKSGRVTSFSNGVLQVAFKAKFQCDRMNKSDYNQAFEDALLRIARQSIKLTCVAAAAERPKRQQAAAVSAPAASEPPLADASKAPPKLQKALDVLGGTLHEL